MKGKNKVQRGKGKYEGQRRGRWDKERKEERGEER